MTKWIFIYCSGILSLSSSCFFLASVGSGNWALLFARVFQIYTILLCSMHWFSCEASLMLCSVIKYWNTRQSNWCNRAQALESMRFFPFSFEMCNYRRLRLGFDGSKSALHASLSQLKGNGCHFCANSNGLGGGGSTQFGTHNFLLFFSLLFVPMKAQKLHWLQRA